MSITQLPTSRARIDPDATASRFALVLEQIRKEQGVRFVAIYETATGGVGYIATSEMTPAHVHGVVLEGLRRMEEREE
jgi:hypothetical protein